MKLSFISEDISEDFKENTNTNNLNFNVIY